MNKDKEKPAEQEDKPEEGKVYAWKESEVKDA